MASPRPGPSLFIPALPWSLADRSLIAPRSPTLERIHARADRRTLPRSDYYARLFALFGAAPNADPGLPVAAATAVIDLPAHSAAVRMRADPVYLVADLRKLLLFDAASFDLDADEARSLLEAINAGVEADGLHIEMGADPKRWYLSLERHPGFAAPAPESIRGGDVDPHLPRGGAAAFWHRVGNEIQMILHASPCNAAREAAGKVPVTGVWFWGAGAAPQLRPGFRRVWTDCPVAAGLAQLAGVACTFRPTIAELAVPDAGGCGDGLIVVTGLREALLHGDAQAWSERLGALDRVLLAPLTRGLRKREFDALRLLSGDLELRLDRRALRRFWRRSTPLRIPPA